MLDEVVATFTPGFCVLLLMKPGEDEDSCNSSVDMENNARRVN